MASSDSARRRRVALLTPLPPAHTGTADYAAALIPELGRLVDLQVFEKPPRGFRPSSYDGVIYQIANNPFHSRIYETALEHPGVVVLHETNLHDLVRGLANHNGVGYLREVVFEVFGRELEDIPKSACPLVLPQPRTFSVSRRLLAASRACIVHSRFAESIVRSKGFAGKVARIPHGAEVRTLDGNACRDRHGIPRGVPVAGIFGYLRPDKLAAECLAMFADLVRRVPDARFLVAGEPHPEVPVLELAAELGIARNVHVLGFQPLAELDGLLAACDVILNLRWPTFGENSGIVARAFGLGKAVVVSDWGASRELPDDACIKVDPTRHQHDVLVEAVAWLMTHPEAAAEIGASAQAWIGAECTWPAVARRYTGLLDSLDDPSGGLPDDAALRGYLERWTEPGSEAAAYCSQHANRLVHTLRMVPPGNGERILEMGCYLQLTPALRELLGYGEVRGCYLGKGGTDSRLVQARDGAVFECAIDLFDAERDVFPYPDGHFGAVLCAELLEHLQADPMWMMSEIHRILRPDGVLVLTTPNAVSLRAVHSVLQGDHPSFNSTFPVPRDGGPGEPRHAREYTPSEIVQLFSGAGFLMVRLETGDYGDSAFPEAGAVLRHLVSLKQPSSLRGECIFAIGRKAGIPRIRRPGWLYG